MKFIGWLLGTDNVESIDAIDPTLAAPWAQDGAGRFWVLLGVATALAIGAIAYVKSIAAARKRTNVTLGRMRLAAAGRVALAATRGALLALVFLTLADPALRIASTQIEYPYLYLVFDGTDSMAIEDDWPAEARDKLLAAVGEKDRGATEAPAKAPKSRMEFVQATLKKDDGALLRTLGDDKQFHLKAFLFDGNSTSQLRSLELGAATKKDEAPDPARLAEQLTTRGQVTSLGAVLADVQQQAGAGRLAGVVLFSDFAHNAGAAPLAALASDPLGEESSGGRAAMAPIHTVGVGAPEAVDLVIDLEADYRLKKAERTAFTVKLSQTGLSGQAAEVRLFARRLGGEYDADAAEIAPSETEIARRTIELAASTQTVEFPFTPDEAGRFEFVAEAAPLTGEVVDQNNSATRELSVIDDHLRLLYVAYEPTWEWRFIKEVFHRDKLVGMAGFRTFLASSDPRVRESNVLFTSTLTPARSEFFASDVIFLDDVPQTALSGRFAEMTREFVSRFGGGLVVIGGPRFGPSELAGTPIGDMLPVIVDGEASLRDEREYRLAFTPHAERYAFMQLGAGAAETERAWRNLGPLPWYQPVARLHDQAVALAEHPSDLCRDGKTRQPLIAIRKYGAGEVVYLGFNETWRLRRMQGERLYRQFWSQLIYRLGMSHALGADKRFQVRTDRPQYRVDEMVAVSVDAYDENFEPLSAESLGAGALEAELIAPESDGPSNFTGGAASRSLSIPLRRAGVFETQLPAHAPGRYSVRVTDPVTKKFAEARFEVIDVSAERRQAVRNVKLQEAIAEATGGKSYDLTTIDKLPENLTAETKRETLVRNHALWSTPLWFLTIASLMIAEWFWRKMIHLA